MLTLDNVVTTDKFEDTTLGPIDNALSALIDIYNASVRAQIAVGVGSQVQWLPDPTGRLMAPVRGQPISGCRGVRFKSAVTGTPARIVADLYTPGDAVFAGGTPNTQTLTAAGQTVQAGLITGEVDGLTGNKLLGTGFTSVRNAVGDYTITFTTPFAAQPLVIVQSFGGNAAFAQVNSVTATTLRVLLWVGVTLTDTSFMFTAQAFQ